MEEASKSKEKPSIIYNTSQSQNSSNENDHSLSKKIYGEMLNKTPYDKKVMEELSLSNDNNPDQIMYFIKVKIEEMFIRLKKFKEYSDSIKTLSTEEITNSNNNITEGKSEDINISNEETKKEQNLNNETLDEVYNKLEKLDSQINSCFESIKNKIEKIKFPKTQSKIEKKENNFENSLSFIDESFSISKTKKIEPKYNYFKPAENILEIRLEIPGDVRLDISHKIDKDITMITVKGIKRQDKEPMKFDDILYNTREFGEFEVNIPLKTESFRISQTNQENVKAKMMSGLCVLQYTLDLPGETTNPNS